MQSRKFDGGAIADNLVWTFTFATHTRTSQWEVLSCRCRLTAGNVREGMQGASVWSVQEAGHDAKSVFLKWMCFVYTPSRVADEAP